MSRPVIIINTHPIQYFVPLHRQMAARLKNFTVWYLEDTTKNNHFDPGFGQVVQWKMPLTDGYDFRFFPNKSKSGINGGFFGLINPGLVPALFSAPKSVVVLYGWNSVSMLLACWFGWLFGHEIWLRGEAPITREHDRKGWKKLARLIQLRGLIFPFVSKFLFIGKNNRDFYRHYGVAENRLSFSPYSVDNDQFQEAARQLSASRNSFKKSLGFPENSRVFLTSGKYVFKKKPMDILVAFQKISDRFPDARLVMIGDGELRPDLENFISKNRLTDKVLLTGFINQDKISDYYAIGDIYIMASNRDETWGLSTNEAMNFGMPLLLSDQIGCVPDLLIEGKNGFSFPCGNTEELASRMEQLLNLQPEVFDSFRHESVRTVSKFSFENNVSNFVETLSGCR